jgi:hypothetical protein
MRFLFTILFLTSMNYIAVAQLDLDFKPYVPEKGGASTLEKLPDRASRGWAAANSPKKTSFIFEKRATVNFESISKDFAPSLLLREMPKQGSKKMEVYNYPENRNSAGKATSNVTLAPIIKGQSFQANPFSISTPNDNDMAISNSGVIVSVINTNIYIRNIISGFTLPVKSLSAFTNPINNLHQEFDPKVMYDPVADKFVLMCMVGFTDSTSQIIVGFSQTNNPGGSWNLYSLPGNPQVGITKRNLWSDYPMIAMTQKELFLTVNLLYNDSSWQTGFVETIVWQMKKEDGYNGTSLTSNLHSNVKFNGRYVRNLCPAKGGSQLYTPNMYFLSNRNLASQNDTVFLVNITDTIGAPSGSLTVNALVSNQPYYFPPDGRQTISTESLATNDCRNLGAFYENGMIHYVHNTKNPANNFSTIYYGTIHGVGTSFVSVNGYLVPNDTMDFAYPNISYSGTSSTDNRAIITFDHSSDKVFAGCSAIQTDGAGNFSPKLRIKNGANYINLLTSNLERWGDYSGSQRKYNNPGEVWMSGYYSYAYNSGFPKAHAGWVAQILQDTTSSTPPDTVITKILNPKNNVSTNATVYPNPAKDIFSVDLDLAKPEYLSFELVDQQGKLIEVLLRDWVKTTHNVFSFSTRDLNKGVYFLKITGNNKTNTTKKIVIN